MPRPLVPFGATIDRAAVIRTTKLLRSFQKKRLTALMGYTAYQAAVKVQQQITERVNGTDLEGPYRRGLSIARVSGIPKSKGVAYSLRISPKAEKVTSINAKKTILYVKPRASRLVPPKPEILILRNYGPWTVDTLPFQPTKRDAVIYSRRVRAKEADAVAKKQQDSKMARKVRTLLDRAGVPPPKADLKLKTPPVIRAIPDVAFEGLRMEFGYGDRDKVPHWRPALRYLKLAGMKRIFKMRDFKDGATKARYTGWKKWPPQVKDTVTASEARAYKHFEKRVRVR